MVCAWVGKEFPYKRQNERRIKFIREGEAIRTMGPLKGEMTPLVGDLVQYSYLENSMDRGALQAIVHGITKSQTRLSN